MSDVDSATVLVVDDEEALAEAYALWLPEEYEVRMASDGQEALDVIDDDVDVVLLDRRMPNTSGDEALVEIRDRGYDCRVAMVTAVDPSSSIVDMEFDDYLTKPIDRNELRRTVEDLLTLAEYDEAVQREFALARKQAALQSQKSQAELSNDERYQRLKAERERLREEVTGAFEEMDHETFKAALRDLPSESD